MAIGKFFHLGSFLLANRHGVLAAGAERAARLRIQRIRRRAADGGQRAAAIGIQTIYFGAAVMPFLAFSTYANQLFQCLGFKAKATFLASCRQGVFFLPAVLLLPLALDCVGVQAAQPVADLCTFLTCVPFVVLFYRKHFR